MRAQRSRSVLRFDDGGWTDALGGDVAVDLVNTVSWRLDPARRVERIPDGAGLVRWAAFVGLDTDDPRRPTRTADAAAARVRTLREQLHRVLRPLAVADVPAAADVAALRSLLVDALSAAEVTGVVPWRWDVTSRSVGHLPLRLGLAAWRLVEHEDLHRLGECAGPGCGWLFLDRTKNGSRRWCSSADCGNRVRARRHRRLRSATSGDSPVAPRRRPEASRG